MIAGGTDRARREEMPGSKVTSAPRAPVPARANTGRWAGLSTSCGVRSEPAACGVARGARARARRARHGVRGVRGAARAPVHTIRFRPLFAYLRHTTSNL